MRLRSSQFVFLLLLLCSVQSAELSGPHLTGASSMRQAAREQRETRSAIARPRPSANQAVDPQLSEPRLDSAAKAALRRPWPMRRPALASATVSAVTGLLRA